MKLTHCPSILAGGYDTYSPIALKNLFAGKKGEQSTHILKPIPLSRLRRVKEIPANENLTMQIASQVYGIETGANGLCFFKTGEPAYITKRFDVGAAGVKLRTEDFSSLTHLHVDDSDFALSCGLFREGEKP